MIVKYSTFSTTTPLSLVIIDSAVDHLSNLIAGTLPTTEVIVLHPAEDGIAQISAVLADRRNIASLHIIAHGSSGRLKLGNTYLNGRSLPTYQLQLQHWKNALQPDAALLLYGCEVAAGDEGYTFVQQLKAIVGLEIAASSTPVGHESQGGNWELDVRTSPIQEALAFQPALMATYPSVFIDTYVDEDFSDASGATPPPGWTIDVLEGDATVDQWRFDNPGDRTVPDFLVDPFAIFDSDYLSNNDLPENVALVTPVFNASSETQLFLEFKQEYLGLIDPDYGSQGIIEVYNGTGWQPVVTQLNDVIGTTRLDISSYAAGVSNAQVRFRWTGNWSYYWSLDDVKVVDALTPGITLSGTPQVSEDNVPDPRNFQFVLDSKPTSEVTISFGVDSAQLQPIAPIIFTPENWNIPQTTTVYAVADDIDEGENQESLIDITVTSADPIYNNFAIEDAIATITDSTIPGYTSYRTVEETLADMGSLAAINPDLASWVDIGDSYNKIASGGTSGYDIYALELTNKAINPAEGKPVLYVEGGLHSREYSTNEVAARFAEHLVSSYGVNADTTWLLDYFKVVVVPVVNPDGRKFAEQGYSWRKNANPNPPEGYDPAAFPFYGVDLNRNFSFGWNSVPGGSSGDPSSDLYRGASPASEPEVQAIETYVSSLFPDQKGPNESDPAPDDATGIFIDLHSYGNTVLYPWGSTEELAPNREGLRNLGLKFGYYTDATGTPYDIYQSIGLYPTDGTADDWAYGTLGVAAYTWELGTTFFESSEYFEASISDQVIAALTYAAKSAYQPYKTSDGPESVRARLASPQVVAGIDTTVTLRVRADDTRYADSNAEGIEEGTDLPTPETIAGGRYSIDAPSWIAGTPTFELTAIDGTLDSPVEGLKAQVNLTGLAAGRHTLFVESLDAAGNYGVPTALFFDVLTPPPNANVIRGTVQDDSINPPKGATNDVVYGEAGDDTIFSGAGQDLILAGRGADFVKGGTSTDLIYGQAGDDILNGDAGADKLYGDEGNDQLTGANGPDLLWGGEGDDSLGGGLGSDTFAIAYGEGIDLIQDFEIGVDVIGLVGTLTFGQLDILQEAGNALITYGGKTLAQLAGIEAIALTAASFTNI